MYNEVVTIRAPSSVGELIILEQEARACFPDVVQNVRRQAVPQWECCVLDARTEDPGPWSIRAQALILGAIIAPALARVVATGAHLTLVLPPMPTGVQSITRVTVGAEPLSDRGLDGPLSVARRLLDRDISDTARGWRALASFGPASLRQRALSLLLYRVLEQHVYLALGLMAL